MQIAAKENNFIKGIWLKIKDQRWIVSILLYGIIGMLSAKGIMFDSIFPFSVAYYGAMVANNKRNIWIGIPLILGIGLNISYDYILFRYLAIILSIALIFIIFDKKLKKTPLRISIYTSLICGLSTTIYHRVSGIILMYDFFLIVTEVTMVFVFTYIFHRIPWFIENKSRKLSLEDIVCGITIIAVGLLATVDIYIYDIKVMVIMAMTFTLVMAFCGGIPIGTLSGVITGMIITVAGNESENIMVVFAISGLIAGLFSKHIRLISCLAVVVFLTIFSFSNYIQVNRMVIELSIGCIIFLAVPRKVINRIKDKLDFYSNDYAANSSYDMKLRKIMGLNLKKYSNIFDDLSFIYGGALEKQQAIDIEDREEIVDKVKDGICVDCDFFDKCWHESNVRTKEVMKEILLKVYKNSRIEKSYIKSELNFSCEYMDRIIFSIVNSIQILGTSFKWQKKLEGSRMVTATQFKGIARSINDMIKELNGKIRFDVDMERKILVQCHKRNILVNNVFVIEKKNDIQVFIEIDNAKMYNEEIEEVISYVLNDDFIVSNEDVDNNIISLVRCPEYKMSVGTSKYAKEMNICGDSYTYENLKSNEYMIALSDGMGTGEKAAHESMVTINALKHLLKIGFEKELALKTINSMLLLKSTEEIFSTVDISIIDLDEGNASFYKMGAASAFIKSADGEIKVIKHGTLPVGIVYQIEIEEMAVKLMAEDIIVMVSDGILDACENEDKIEWMKNTIAGIKSREPQTIADLILNKAIDEYEDRERDDMTVIVAKMHRTKKAVA